MIQRHEHKHYFEGKSCVVFEENTQAELNDFADQLKFATIPELLEWQEVTETDDDIARERMLMVQDELGARYLRSLLGKTAFSAEPLDTRADTANLASEL